MTAAALSDPDAQPRTDGERARAKPAWRAKIKVIQLKLGMRQAAFAEVFGLPRRMLQEWGKAAPGRRRRFDPSSM